MMLQERRDWMRKRRKRLDAMCATRAFWLWAIAREHKIKIHRIAEIGVHLGKHAYQLRQRWPVAELFLIDPWRPLAEMAETIMHGRHKNEQPQYWREVLQEVKTKFEGDLNVRFVQSLSAEAAPTFAAGYFDFVFIDGNHDYAHCKQDIELWLPKVRPGGALAGHDYRKKTHGNQIFGVREAVRDVLGTGNVIIGPDNTWWFQKGK